MVVDPLISWARRFNSEWEEYKMIKCGIRDLSHLRLVEHNFVTASNPVEFFLSLICQRMSCKKLAFLFVLAFLHSNFRCL